MENPIRSYFSPLQPSIDHSGQIGVRYQEYKPHEDLRDYVHCYWRLWTETQLEKSFTYRVVSDGCIDLLQERSQAGPVFITGFSSSFLEYDLGKSFNYLGIRFLPTGFPALFDIPASTLTNVFTELPAVLNSLDELWSARLQAELSLDEAAAIFDSMLRDQITASNKRDVDQRVLKAMELILKARGNINLSELDVGVSERQLRRLFEYYFGESPKTFAKIIRFQNILNAKPSTGSLERSKAFYDEGYYDQAHFIKEFKSFYGVTPSRAFGR